ncbi:MAG: T9SS C-terminal target domain-containing protein [Candidatus Zixiibacteriota bacterium]|nr:MAG: T9SS C-terminal target domain-containing protein [candidate division Zixibacteria bacterium]
MNHTLTRWTFVILAALALALPAAAKPKPEAGKEADPGRQTQGNPSADQQMLMTVSNVWSAVSNFANYGDANSVLPSGQWPAGSGNNYVWEGRFWVGALVQGKKRVSHADYGDYEFHPADDDPFYLGPGKSIQDSRVIYDDLAATTTHTPLGIRVLQRTLSWSMPEYDDFHAFEYEIINTGLIGTLSNFYATWVFDNDVATLDVVEANIDDNVDYDGWDGDDTQTDEVDWVDPMDLDGDGLDGYDEWGLPYGWTNADNPNADPNQIEPDGVFDEYQIFLNPDGPVILGQAGDKAGQPLTDADGNELHGWLISRNMSIIYDGDNNAVQGNDTGERSLPIPCDGWTGGRLLYTPRAPYFTTPEDTLPRPFAHQWWNWNSDPGNDDEKFEYMSATHPAGMGYNFIPNAREIGAPTFDYRWLTSSGPFTLPAGDTLRVVYAHCIGQGLKGLRAAADQAMIAYYSGSQTSSPAQPSAFNEDLHWVLPVPPPIPNLNYTGMSGGVRLAWDNHAEYEIDPLLGYSDFEGYKVYRAPYAPTNWQMIAAFDNLPDSAVYVINTEGDTLNPGAPEDLPDVTHAFTDTGGVFLGEVYEQPVNSVPYYYVVVAYDSYKPANPEEGLPEFMPQESAKSNYLKDPSSGAPMPVYPIGFAEDVSTSGVENVKVVPNPYRGTNPLESRYENTVTFINLPPACKITILTLAGDIVDTIDHTDGTNAERWDLLSKNTQSVVSGLYIFVVETESDKKIGKFVIAR